MSTIAENLMGWWARGRAGLLAKKTDKQMHLVETLPLGGQKQLLLVRCGEKQFLVGAGKDGVQSIVAVSE